MAITIRKVGVVLARNRLGHTRATHSYILLGEEKPQCIGCDTPFTVRHMILKCVDFSQIRNKCFHEQLFQDILMDGIMIFLKQ